jgi:hypothetical protein
MHGTVSEIRGLHACYVLCARANLTRASWSAAANADLVARFAAVEAKRDAALLLAAQRLEELTAREASDFLCSADALLGIVNALLAAIDGSRQALARRPAPSSSLPAVRRRCSPRSSRRKSLLIPK